MFLSLEVLKFYDVEISCIYRLIEPLEKIRGSDVDSIIAIAGMEGALPSVLAGLRDLPIIAVHRNRCGSVCLPHFSNSKTQ